MKKVHWDLVVVALMLAFAAGFSQEHQTLFGGMAFLMTWGALL